MELHEIETLKRENRLLRHQRDRLLRRARLLSHTAQYRIQRLEWVNRLLRGGYLAGGTFLALLLLGPGLSKAAYAYFQSARRGRPVPVTETADLFVAIVRRVLTVGALGLLVAAIPTVLLWKQNLLIAAQNESFQDQNSKLQAQLVAQAQTTRKQEADTLLVRRNELLRTLYELENCDKTEGPQGDQCPPRHPIRLRRDAALTLAQLDGDELNLRSANLEGADLSLADFTNADLSEATLVGTALGFSNFDRADLEDADLERASLWHASLRGTWLVDANLREVDFKLANLGDAKLFGADLRGSNVRAEQLTRTCGDSETFLPSGIARPEHWLRTTWVRDTPPNDGCPPRP